MSSVRLSICIPTYNFGEFIGATLDSIIKQAGDDVEVVIVDGASTDNTPEIVRGYQQQFSRIRYKRLEKKGGVDKDLAITLELARGDYCWLMSSDDIIKPGAIRRILDEIQGECDIYLCNRTECDRDLHPLRNRQWFAENIVDHTFNLKEKDELIHYFNTSRSMGALFSYISSIIVSRNKWNEIMYDEKFTGSNYAHVYRLFTILRKGGRLKYIRDSLVLCRGDNDSFREQGIVNRFLIDFKGYQLLAEGLGFENDMLKTFHSVIRREHKWYTLTILRNHVTDGEKWNTIEQILKTFGYSRTELFLIRYFGSSEVITVLTNFLRKIAKSMMLMRGKYLQK